MKVKIKIVINSIMFVMLFSVVANAKTTTLFKHSDNTYVTSSHPDDYFADTYKGVASVIGTDRKSVGDKTYSFAWTEITYDVQGSIFSERAHSEGHYDKKTKTKTLNVKDKWNNGRRQELTTIIIYDILAM